MIDQYDMVFYIEDYEDRILYQYSYYDITLLINEHIGREFKYKIPRIYYNLN